MCVESLNVPWRRLQSLSLFLIAITRVLYAALRFSGVLRERIESKLRAASRSLQLPVRDADGLGLSPY